MPKTFATPCFLFVRFLSLTSHCYQSQVMSHAMPLLVSHIGQASSFCVNGYYSSLSHNEQQEDVVNVSLHCFVRINLWLIVKTLSNFCGAYLQQGFLFPKSLFLPLPTSSPRRFLKPLQFFSSPCLLEKLLKALQGVIRHKPSTNASYELTTVQK